MPSRNDTRSHLLQLVKEMVTDDSTRQTFLEKIATADDAALPAIAAEINLRIAETARPQNYVFAEINRFLGIMRISGRAQYMLKDRREWLSNGLVEAWATARDAADYLLRNDVPIYETRVLPDGKTITIDHFRNWRQSKEADYFAGVIYHPEGPKRYRERFNLWNGWGVEPVAGDNHRLFLDLIRDGFCARNDDYFEYVLSWLAHLVQKPAERPGTAVAIVSHQGAGKGTFIEVLSAMIGELNCSGDISNKDLTGGFNSKIANKLLINLNEATFSGNHEQVEFMKKLITDPTFRCEYKGLESFDAPNFSRLIVTTNNTNWGRLDADDRRYLILEPAKDFPADPDFFGRLRTAMFEQGGVANLMHFLEERDISGWRASKLPARTTGFDTLEDSLTSRSEIKFFYELAGNGYVEMPLHLANDKKMAPWNEAPEGGAVIRCGSDVKFADLYAAYCAYCDENRRMVRVAKNKFSMTFKLVGAKSTRFNNVPMVRLAPQQYMRKAIGEILSKWELDWSARFPEPEEVLLAGLEDDDRAQEFIKRLTTPEMIKD